ncbi:hypothetical protein CI109_101720 [Kwoniella shandongensis]|uniref:Uncharacterized protein n=1 Tax=Kwoniella shandongensis TaxID=1734106 RepID=A0A5M6C5D1_9TREE|nr:uncharacterized protein CI109_001157 [Kwoniella shandongensis]KAA5530356.1 hypothetical protein CI109_001157 [Kwoniella shandongensis]
MAFHLDPIVIAAIASGVVAVLLAITFTLYRLLHRNRRSHSALESKSPETQISLATTIRPGDRSSVATFGFVHYPNSERGLITPSSMGGTTLVTPSTATPTSQSAISKRLKKAGVGVGAGGVLTKRESEDMVVITYEDGLRKMGINPESNRKPHHILFPEYDTAQEGDEVNLTPPGIPGREEDGVAWGRVGGIDSPRLVPGRIGSPRIDAGADQKGGGNNPLESTWLPSYYHRSEWEGEGR